METEEEEIEHLRKELNLHKRRLWVLEERAAQYGIHEPEWATIERDDIRRHIYNIQTKLKDTSSDTPLPSDSPSPFDSPIPFNFMHTLEISPRKISHYFTSKYSIIILLCCLVIAFLLGALAVQFIMVSLLLIIAYMRLS